MKKTVYSSDFIDSRVYNDIFLLSKILIATEKTDKLTSKEKEKLMKHFEKPRN